MCAPVAREKIVFTTQKYHKLYTLGKLNNINNKSNNDKKGEVFQKSYMSSYNKYYIFSKTNAVWIKKNSLYPRFSNLSSRNQYTGFQGTVHKTTLISI